MSDQTPLDFRFNYAVIEIAATLFPSGFLVSAKAPQDFETLTAIMDAGGPMIVWAGGSDATIYADRSVNYAFRAWHDYCHWIGGHALTAAGEAAACHMQCQHLLDRYGDTDTTKYWCRILDAEINGQGAYFKWHKRFPDDQRAFVLEYLKESTEPLRWPHW